MDLREPKPIIFTAQSRHLFYCNMLICKYVLEQDAVPVNPFTLWGYFLYELVDRDLVRRGNNNMIRVADQLWVFGPIADGVLAEIEYAIGLHKPMRFFGPGSQFSDIRPISVDELVFEPEALAQTTEQELKELIADYLSNSPGSS
jgi:hypothetical protein